MIIQTEDKLFVDTLDGKWTLGLDMGKHGTISLGNFEEHDSWLYPKELGFDNIINVFSDQDNENLWHFNIYELPYNWKDIVTNDGGKDGKKSIHDIMILVS